MEQRTFTNGSSGLPAKLFRQVLRPYFSIICLLQMTKVPNNWYYLGVKDTSVVKRRRVIFRASGSVGTVVRTEAGEKLLLGDSGFLCVNALDKTQLHI